MPTEVLLNISPWQVLFHKTPNYSFFCVFGCACYPWLRPYTHNKLKSCSTKCVFLGYSLIHKGYRCLAPTTGRVYLSLHVVFDEHLFPLQSTSTQSISSSTEKDPLSAFGPLTAWLPRNTPIITHPFSSSIPDPTARPPSSNNQPTVSPTPSSPPIPIHVYPIIQPTIIHYKKHILLHRIILVQPMSPLSCLEQIRLLIRWLHGPKLALDSLKVSKITIC